MISGNLQTNQCCILFVRSGVGWGVVRGVDRKLLSSILFHSEFQTQCDLVRLLSVFSVLRFPYPVAAYIFFLVFPSAVYFLSTFPSITVLEGSCHATCDHCSYPFFLNWFITACSITKWCNTTCYIINKVSEKIVTYSTFATIETLVCTRVAFMRISYCYWYNCWVAFVSKIRH
jgi:hypothetical protein